MTHAPIAARLSDELYFAIPGGRLAEVVERLGTIVDANRELEKYPRARVA